MKGYLLDVNVLLALGWPNHVHHGDAQRWFEARRHVGWATCAVTELGFVRLSSNPRFSANPQTPENACALLRELRTLPKHHYWQEEPGGLSSPACQRAFSKVLNHELVTDAFLVAVATAQGGKLATFDRVLPRLFGDAVELIAPPV
jgi:hypothetical protein